MPCSTDRSSQCRRMPTTKRASRTSDSASWPRRNAASLLRKPGLDHHLLAVVRPAFDERRRREQGRLAHLRLHLPQVLVVQEVAGKTSWIEMVHSVGMLKSRRCSFWRSGGQPTHHVGQVVEARGLACSRTGPGVHMLANAQR